jgi:hypothetical protein
MKQITVTTNVYKFDELSEEGKQKAIEGLWDINVDYEWWDFAYEDAKLIGVKINGFDIDRGSYCDIKLINGEIAICQAILKSHGEMCDTFKMAEKFLPQLQSALSDYEIANDDDDIDYDVYLEAQDKYNDLKDEFKNELQEKYLIILRKEYEYLTSEEAIIETIEANDYDFTEDGKLF